MRTKCSAKRGTAQSALAMMQKNMRVFDRLADGLEREIGKLDLTQPDAAARASDLMRDYLELRRNAQQCAEALARHLPESAGDGAGEMSVQREPVAVAKDISQHEAMRQYLRLVRNKGPAEVERLIEDHRAASRLAAAAGITSTR